MKRIKVTGVKTMGALVRYCGHKGVFIADIHHIAGAVVIRGNPNIEKVLSRSDSDYEAADYHLLDFPGPIYWNPRDGIFVVPKGNLKEVER